MASYVTLSEFKAFMRITDAVDDVLAQSAIDSASLLIDEACNTIVGTTAPTASVKLACNLQAERLFKRRDAPFGVLGSPEFGNYTRIQAALDPDVQVLLDGFGDRLRYGTTI